MQPHYYTLDGHEPVALDDVLQWAEWFGVADRTVAYTVVVPNEVGVSTVFLGLDHNFSGDGPPILFETLVMGGERDGEMDRYRTWKDAEAGHAEIVESIRYDITTMIKCQVCGIRRGNLQCDDGKVLCRVCYNELVKGDTNNETERF